MSVAINIENVVKRFGKDTIINGLSLNIKKVSFLHSSDHPDVEKTTLLRMIIGFNSIEGGEIKLDEKLTTIYLPIKGNMGYGFFKIMLSSHICR